MKPIAPLLLRGEEWRHRQDPDAGPDRESGGLWIRRINTGEAATARDYFGGVNSPRPQNRQEAELMIEYIDRLADALGDAMWPDAYECAWCHCQVTHAHHHYHPICLRCFFNYPASYERAVGG